MPGVSRDAALLIALFGAVPVGLITALLTWGLLGESGNMAITPAAQQLMAMFAGLAYGLAAFVFLYNARRSE
jgi:hypothetical protein